MQTSLSFVVFLLFAAPASFSQTWEWETLKAVGRPTPRHEASLVAYDGQVYLIGGRRVNPVDVYDPAANRWIAKSKTPIELHHFQAVTLGNAIYLMGAMTGPFPSEKPLEQVIVYHPDDDRYEMKHSIPASRRRGGAGAAVYEGKIYLVGGITNGHLDGFQPWLDVYDPATGNWTTLEDAPHARDHFQAVVHDHKLYAVGGRTTSKKTNQLFDLTVPAVDVYDLRERRWLADHELPDLPSPRAGNMAMIWNGELIVGGGESGVSQAAYDRLDSLQLETRTWRQWPSLRRGRHGSGFAVVGGYVYTASGSGRRGGSPELDSIERLLLPPDL